MTINNHKVSQRIATTSQNSTSHIKTGDIALVFEKSDFVPNQKVRLGKLFFILILVIGGNCFPASAQSVNKTENKADQVLKSNGRVNPSTLALELSIPLGGYAGRAGNSKPVSIDYSSKVWDSAPASTWVFSGSQSAVWTDLAPRFAKEEIVSVGGVLTRITNGSHGGWTSSLGAPRIKYSTSDNYWNEPQGEMSGGEGRLWKEPTPLSAGTPGPETYPLYYVKRLSIVMPDGSTIEFRQDDSLYLSGSTIGGYGNFDWNGTYLSVDGTRLKLVVSGTAAPVLYLPDGGHYEFGAGSNGATATAFFDSHGNKSIYDLSNRRWTDTLGRVITDPFPVADNAPAPVAGTKSYAMPGFGNNNQTVQFVWTTLDAQHSVLKYPAAYYCTGPNAKTNIPSGASSLFVGDEGSKIRACGTATPFNPVVLTEVRLPNGAAYKFHYNLYGEMDRIDYPTGGYERYEYGWIKPLSAADNGTDPTPNDQFNRGVKKRWVSEGSAGAAEMLWEYAVETQNTGDPASDYYKVVTNAPDGTMTEQYLFNESSEIQYPWGFGNIAVGRAYDERSYRAGTGSLASRLMSRKLTKYTMTENVVPGNRQTNGYTATRDLRAEKSVSVIFEPNESYALVQLAETVYEVPGQNGAPFDADYFAALNAKQTKTYHYKAVNASSAASANIDALAGLFTTADVASITETDYLYDANYKARNISGLVMETRVRDASNTTKAKSQISYDETLYLEATTITNATSWTNPNTSYRGLPTSVRHWYDIINNQYVGTHSSFDQFGNPRKSWDGRGNISEVQYADNYTDSINRNAYALPTKTISAVPGGNGSNTAFETYIKYEFNTGFPVSTIDPNGAETRMEYADPLLRPTKISVYNGSNQQVGAATITEYGVPDTNGILSPAQRFVKTKTQIDATNWKEGYAWFDGLSRPVKSQSVDTSGDVFALMCYDQYGRQSKTSNPFRNVSSPNCSSTNLEWTTSTYDAAGRPWKITTSDNAIVETDYSLATSVTNLGTVVTVTDQAGKQRRSITNSLGLLTRVDEPFESKDSNGNIISITLGTINSPAQPTNYSYDVLNNLIGVSQGTQTRSFTYDSLSRLKSASNPESGLTSYQYDADGNLTTKVDGRNITTNYLYDALSRINRKSYSGETDYTTPTVYYFYDNIPNAKEKLVKVSNSISATEYSNFDILGRALAHKQMTDGQTYSTTYVYNLSGTLTEQTYHSGRVVRNVLGANGNLAEVESKRNSSDIFRNYATNFDYTAAGRISSLKLGNGKFENTLYNSRLQPIQIGLGSSSTNQNLLRLNFDYGLTDNNGNVKSQTTTVPSIGNISGFTAHQTYSYDSLNRLKQAEETINNNQTPNWKQRFNYDRFGNRRFDEANTTTLLTNCPTSICNPQIDSNTNKLVGYTFDNAGNTKIDAENRTFIYDGENKQVEVKDQYGSSVGIYFYDGDGRRVKKNSSTETTIFVYDVRGQLVAEYSTQISQTPNTSYLTMDFLGTTRIQTNTLGQVISRHDYQPFGEEIQRANYGMDSVRKKFTGYERDAETNLDYAVARMYSNQLGRFTTIDMGSFIPADPQNFNRYLYVQNNPMKFVDPTGNDLEISGTDAQNFFNWLEKNSGLTLKYKTKNGVTTITGSSKNKNFTGPVNKKFAEAVKKAIDAKETAKFNVGSNMTGQEGSDVVVDDNGDAWNARFTNGNNGNLRTSNLDMADIQSLDNQAPELGLALVGHALVEGIEMRKPGGNYENTGDCGAHCVGLKTEAEILSEATNSKQETRFQPPVNSPNGQITNNTSISFVYTTVQYDISFKSGVTANKISPPTVQRPKKNK